MELQEVKRSENENIYVIKDESVMTSALEVLTQISSSKRIVLLAKGDLIPNAVAVANIVTENMLKGNSSIDNIKLDSIISEDDGQMTSNIEITLIKN
jgi:DNA-binding protein|tara:strand:+ start:1513 stop:1803 length:291 start_codon:yes stop_codon:yes gene_type:complete